MYNDSAVYQKLTITYGDDPTTYKPIIYTSSYDPFPDSESNTNSLEHYRTSIYTYEYYITNTNTTNLTLKRNINTTTDSNYLYIAIMGNNLTFNLRVTNCTSLDCTTER